MRKGLYLYCFRKKNSATLSVVKTIDEGEVSTLPYEDLEAVVSGVDLERFSSGEIQKKAEEDINWIKEKAQVHEHVIEQAMGRGGKIVPVIPMKFGTIFKTKKSLEEMMSKHYAKFKASLENLAGKQEWGVKVYLNEAVFEKHLEEESEEVAQKKKEIASLPKGMDFFAKKQVEEVVKQAKDKELKRTIQEIFGNLEKIAVEASQGKNLDKAITGKEEPMILNLNLLIKEEKVAGFQKDVTKLKGRYQNLGLIIQESGPWPPYNFVEI